MRLTTLLVLSGAVVALLSTSETTLQKLRIFVDAFVSIADETLFVLLCTYCVVPLLVYQMHGLLLRENGPDNERHLKKFESAHWRQGERKTPDGNGNGAYSGVVGGAEHAGSGKSDFAYGFFANFSFTVVGVIIMLRIVKELFGVNVSDFFNFASTLSVGIGFAFNDTINNLISGTVTQLSLGLRHGDEVRCGRETWYVNEVGTLGITISQRQCMPHGGGQVGRGEPNAAEQGQKDRTPSPHADKNGEVGTKKTVIDAMKNSMLQIAQAEAEERAQMEAERGGRSVQSVVYIQQFVGHTRFANSFARVSGPHEVYIDNN